MAIQVPIWSGGRQLTAVQADPRLMAMGMDMLNRVVDSRKLAGETRFNEQQDAGLANFMATLQGAKNPEDLARLEASGAFNPAQYGVTDAARLLRMQAAPEARLASLYQQDTAKMGQITAKNIFADQRRLLEKIKDLV